VAGSQPPVVWAAACPRTTAGCERAHCPPQAARMMQRSVVLVAALRRFQLVLSKLVVAIGEAGPPSGKRYGVVVAAS